MQERMKRTVERVTAAVGLTPEQVADQMEHWFQTGACDGFILQPSYLPGELDDICTMLVPELQRRGLIRAGYEGATLREHLGLARPRSRWQPSS